jgi:hypothetical protein
MIAWFIILQCGENHFIVWGYNFVSLYVLLVTVQKLLLFIWHCSFSGLRIDGKIYVHSAHWYILSGTSLKSEINTEKKRYNSDFRFSWLSLGCCKTTWHNILEKSTWSITIYLLVNLCDLVQLSFNGCTLLINFWTFYHYWKHLIVMLQIYTAAFGSTVY